jgi:hypothetical protein
MITREDLNGKTREEIVKLLEDDIANHAAIIEALETEDEVLDKEKDLMLIMDEHEVYMKQVKYDLPTDCNFDGQHYTKKTIFEMLVKFLDNQELAWEHVYGMYGLVKIWSNKDAETVEYGIFDSTLRVLGTLKYKGFTNWKNIQAINEYFSPCQLEYSKDTAYIIYLSKLHDNIMKAQDKFHPQTEVVNEGETAVVPL